MRLPRMFVLAAVAAALVPSAAVAKSHVTRLSLRAADRAADRAASGIADDWQGDDDTTIDDYDLGDCERVSRTKADCDVTYYLDDDSQCDDTIHVKVNRRGRVRTTSDSDDGDTQSFEDCTSPDDDPAEGDDGSVDDGGDDPGLAGDDDNGGADF